MCRRRLYRLTAVPCPRPNAFDDGEEDSANDQHEDQPNLERDQAKRIRHHVTPNQKTLPRGRKSQAVDRLHPAPLQAQSPPYRKARSRP